MYKSGLLVQLAAALPVTKQTTKAGDSRMMPLCDCSS